MLKTLFCFLRNGLFQACIFGHALLLAICKILLLPPSGIYTRSQAPHRGVWVKYKECWRYLWISLGDRSAKYSQWLKGRSSHWVSDVVRGIHYHFICCVLSPGCCSANYLCPQECNTVLWMWQEKNKPFRQWLAKLGKPGARSLSPTGEITSQKKTLLV